MCFGPIAQLAEHRADNAGVSGSSPLGPTNSSVIKNGAVAQLGERVLCKHEVGSSILLCSTMTFRN